MQDVLFQCMQSILPPQPRRDEPAAWGCLMHCRTLCNYFLICSIKLIMKPEGEAIIVAFAEPVSVILSPRVFTKPLDFKNSYASSKLSTFMRIAVIV